MNPPALGQPNYDPLSLLYMKRDGVLLGCHPKPRDPHRLPGHCSQQGDPVAWGLPACLSATALLVKEEMVVGSP